MYSLEGRDSFEHIRRSVKLSHFVASIIPLSLLVYFSIKYVYPYVTQDHVTNLPVSIGIVLVLAVAVSVLGLMLSTKATNSSIGSAEELNRKMNSLFDITKQFRETLYLDVLLENIVNSAMNLTSAELGALLLFDEEGRLRIKVSSGIHSEEMTNRVVQSGDGFATVVAETGYAALSNNVSTDPRYNAEFDRETGYETMSIICVPLIYSNEIIGALELRNKMQGKFTEHDEAILSSLADQAGLSIAQNSLSEGQKTDVIHITEILVGTQDLIQDKKGHARRVANYANLIGKHLDLSEDELKRLYYACLFHDIGFMKINMREQWDREIIMNHPRLGYDMIKSISLWKESADIILCHHERYDGTGYPSSKKQDEIPLGAKILFVADVFDVLTSKNSYREQLDFDAALKEINAHSGTQFDPAVVDAFMLAIHDSGVIE